MTTPQQEERKYIQGILAASEWRDHLIFLIECYGCARDAIEHQGKFSAEWMAEIKAHLDSLAVS